MPLRWYKCQSCEKVFEEIVNGDPVVECECGGNADKVISCPGFILKGHGWAKDGYASKPSSCLSKKKSVY